MKYVTFFVTMLLLCTQVSSASGSTTILAMQLLSQKPIQNQESLYVLANRQTTIRRQDFEVLYQVGNNSGVPWQILAGIYFEESSNGKIMGDNIAENVISGEQLEAYRFICEKIGLQPRVASKGEMGPFQFQPLTWQDFGHDADKDRTKNPYSLADSATAAANYLIDLGYHDSPFDAILKYKGGSRGQEVSEAYVNRVLHHAQQMGLNLTH